MEIETKITCPELTCHGCYKAFPVDQTRNHCMIVQTGFCCNCLERKHELEILFLKHADKIKKMLGET